MLGRSRFRSRSRYLTGGAFPNAALYLNLLSGSLDSRVTFTRGSNATLVDGTGRIVYAPANLLLWSQEFDNAVWSKTGATVAANSTAAPDGTSTADKIAEDASTGVHRVALSLAATPGVFSVYAKAAERPFLLLATGVANEAAWFDLVTGSLGTVQSAATATITDVGNGWYRCTVVSTGATNLQMYASTANGVSTYAGTTGSGIFIWGAQLEPVTYQTVPGPYVATTSAAYYGPRFDYNPVTLAPLGLLIEEARTNLTNYSEQFNDAWWSKIGGTITANATTAPDGASTADKFVEDTSNSAHLIFRGTALTQTSTISLFVKAAERSIVGIGNSTDAEYAQFNLINGTVISAGSGTISAGSIIAFGNGWYRISCLFTFGGVAKTLGLALYQSSGVRVYTGDGVSGAFIWGAQLEAGSFATSYIPTVASQVTRNADVATMTGTNFSSWYNQPEGTFVADFDDYSGIANFANIYRADDGTVNNRICILKNNSNTSIRFEVTTAGSGQALLGTTIGSAVNPTRHASAYKDNDFAACANGGTVATDGAGTVPSGINILRLGRDTAGAAGNLLNGHIRQIAYFNSRLPNAQLQALTAPPLITSLSLDFINGVYEG